MRRNHLKEAQQLNRLELYNDIKKYILDEYGLTVSVEPVGLNHHIYIGDYILEIIDETDDAIAKDIFKKWNKLAIDSLKAEYVYPTQFGYQVISVPIKEFVPYSETDDLQLTITENKRKKIVKENAEANIILDKNYIWIFTILDKFENILVDNITDIDVAVKEAYGNIEAVKVIATPWVDPDPNNAEVDLVLADNIGPVTFLDKEVITKEGE